MSYAGARRAMTWVPAALLLVLALASPASAADPPVPCAFGLATAGGQALTCPLGGIRNIVDVEGGSVSYENGLLDRGKLRLNLSGGETVDRNTGRLVREAIALNPDVGGCTLIYDGRKTLTASFCPNGFGERSGIQFHWRPTMLAGLQVCDAHGCMDVGRQLRQLSAARRAHQRLARLTLRLKRVERQMARLRTAGRAL